jgi:hypothetical protein
VARTHRSSLDRDQEDDAVVPLLTMEHSNGDRNGELLKDGASPETYHHNSSIAQHYSPTRAGDSDDLAERYANDAELTGLSLYEKKCVLVNRELEMLGMGRYQWYIRGLCGFGYMIDLLWAQAFGLVLSPLQQELGFSPSESGNISVAFSSGLTAGAFVWGVLADIVGRRWAFNLTCLFSSVFGLALGGSNTYTAFLVLTAFVGFGVGGNIPIDTTITLEFIPKVHILRPPSAGYVRLLTMLGSEPPLPPRDAVRFSAHRRCDLQRDCLRLYSLPQLLSQLL